MGSEMCIRDSCEEMQEYLGMLYGLKKKDRIFTVTKSYLHHEMDRGAKAAGVKLLGIFIAICTVGIIVVGYFFNAIQYLIV